MGTDGTVSATSHGPILVSFSTISNISEIPSAYLLPPHLYHFGYGHFVGSLGLLAIAGIIFWSPHTDHLFFLSSSIHIIPLPFAMTAPSPPRSLFYYVPTRSLSHSIIRHSPCFYTTLIISFLFCLERGHMLASLIRNDLFLSVSAQSSLFA